MNKYDFQLHEGQLDVATNASRFKVLAAGRRFGKSTLSLALAVKHCLDNSGVKAWIVCPTFQQSKDIYWRSIEKVPFWTNLLISQGLRIKKNDSELLLEFPNKSLLQLKGSDREDTLRGSGLSFVILDEASSMKPNVWVEIIQPSLIDSGGKALFISSPKGFDWFYELWMKGQRGDKDWKSWRYTSYENPLLDKHYLDQAKKDSDEDVFASEYLAEFRRFSGLVYKDFDRSKHVVDQIELKDGWTYYRAIDFGFVNASAVLFAAISDKGELYIYDEIYQAGLKTPDLASLISQKSGGRFFSNTVADSAQISDIEELKRYGFGIMPIQKRSGAANESWTEFRIRKVAEKLRNNTLKIFKSCPNLIFEFENYRYHVSRDETQQIREIPLKLNDHALDALSYLIVNLPERIEPVYEQQVYHVPTDHLGRPTGRTTEDLFRIGK